MASIEDKLKEVERQLADRLRELPPIIGDEVVNFALANFDKQGWQSNGLHPWPQRKNPTKWGKQDDPTRRLLQGEGSGKLKGSIRVGQIQDDKVQVIAGGETAPYARVHNEGFKGIVHQHVGEHFRTTRKGKRVKVKAHERTINQNIPKRQFIGNFNESPELANRITQAIRETLNEKL